jgi:succinate dehydrogenase / fumarate reductase, membrane anchor subunit
MVKQAPVGAHYGLRDWLGQRVTAILMLLYTLFMLGFVFWCAPRTYEDWRLLFSGWFIRSLTMLFFVSLLYHAWVGMRDIWMDYVKSTALRLTLMCATVALLFFYAVWSVTILWGR